MAVPFFPCRERMQGVQRRAPAAMMAAMVELPYLAGYPAQLQQQVRDLLARDALAPMLARKYPDAHQVRNDAQLYAYVQACSDTHLRRAPPLGKVCYDGKLQVLRHALGTHTTISRVQGSRLKASREIRIASVFRDAPAAFLEMIVVHELAHTRESEHNKAFYRLCTHMAPDYHQREFDLRLWLTCRDLARRRDGRPPATATGAD